MDETRTGAGEELRNPHVHHEPGDINAVFLTKFGIGMSLLIIVMLFGLWGLFEFFVKRTAEWAAVPAAVVGVTPQRLPPEPRLQPNPSRDMREMRATEDQMMNQYAWVDPDKGIVRIPVARAIDLTVQRGLPVLPGRKTQ
ncbi:MAG TPA: hypothetical protein VMU80_28370 [Bryobacteraceae bacterium]|nr:hypothetical protein [Bryobacteraceae bacterium]